MRQRYKPWADDFIQENDHLIISDPAKHKENWKGLFNNNHPIHLEIGTGKGQFLEGMAQQHPELNFIGIEVAKSVIVTAAEKIIEAEVDNVLLVNVDAHHLTDLFAENEVNGIYLNFSDPWPKNRHEKRRLTYHTFLKQYEHILDPSGEIIFKTDNQGLFEYSLISFSKYGVKLKEVNLDLHALEDPYNVMTEYEEKYSRKGNRIYRLRASFV
jgi:tRNA (guanine-N7-)-methyltransferase